MKTGKGARQAKGSRGGKGSSQKTKPLKTVKAADLAELSSDDDGGEQDTVSLLQSLLGGGSGASGRILDLADKGVAVLGQCQTIIMDEVHGKARA